jgi:hypothetical protein
MKLRVRAKKPGYSYDPRKDGVSQSMLQTYIDCRQKAYLNIIKGWSPKGASYPLIYGDISHGALERALRMVMVGKFKKVNQILQSVDQFVTEAHAAWLEANPNAETAAKDMAEESKAILRQLLPVYWMKWGKKDLETEWTKVETVFKVPLKMADGTEVPLVGKYDGVYTRNGKSCLFETKNKSRWSDQLIDLLPLDLQLGTYLTALSLIEKKEPSLVTYNILRRPSERRKKDETLLGFASRIAENARKDDEHFFVRFPIELTTDEKTVHKKRIQLLVQEFYTWWLEACEFEKGDVRWNSNHCENKYGTCQNLRICSRNDFTGHEVKSAAHPEL